MSKKPEKMRREYDFIKGVRGKHAASLAAGHTTIINKADGTTQTVETRPIFLESDVQAYFPDTKAVNQALRQLIALVPEKRA